MRCSRSYGAATRCSSPIPATRATPRPPAAAARSIGWTDVPMLCMAEMEVTEPLSRCVRVLLHVAVADGRRLRPVYLREARALRPDLVVDA